MAVGEDVKNPVVLVTQRHGWCPIQKNMHQLYLFVFNSYLFSMRKTRCA